MDLKVSYTHKYDILSLDDEDLEFVYRFRAKKGKEYDYADLAVVAVVDRSGSMGQEMELLKATLIHLCNEFLNTNNFFGIVSFNHKVVHFIISLYYYAYFKYL